MPLPIDSLRPDTALLSALRADTRYDYSRELVPSQTSIWDVLQQRIYSYFVRLLNGFNGGDPSTLLITIAIIIIIAAIVVFLWKRPGFFFRTKKVVNEEVNDEDNIYGVDFDKEITKARTKGDWRRVVRLLYLQTLRSLADSHRIDWRPSKTPTQYTYEVKDDEFRQMTRIFLRVRYGGFPADEQMAEEMTTLQEKIVVLEDNDSRQSQL